MVQRRRSPRRLKRARTAPADRPKESAAPSADNGALVEVGIVRRPWGFDGSIAVTQHSEDPGRFSPGDEIVVGGAHFSIERVSSSGRSTVLKLDSINSQEQAGALRGKTIEIDAAALPPLPAGAFYHYQIIGARVVTIEGEELGTVSEILETGSNDVYLVRAEGSPGRKAPSEIPVPALKDVIVDVDIERGVIVVDLPEGLR